MPFTSGIELSERFHAEFVEPILSSQFPNLLYASALIGPGSEVLGYDTEMSMDHDWGPRVLLFLLEQDMDLCEEIHQALLLKKPDSFYGCPVDLNRTVISTVSQYMKERLAIDVSKGLDSIDWLTIPSQALAEIVGGAVFRDDIGQLTAVREQLRYYPHDIWLFLMASNWYRIGQEEHLVLRSGFMGDELGSSIIGSRIVKDMMNLCFLMERRYAPYPKWFGTAFKKLNVAEEMLPILRSVQFAETWRQREEALCKAYELIARKHNRLGISEKQTEQVSCFYNRPFKVIKGAEFAQSITNSITDIDLLKIGKKRLIGGIDEITDNTDFRLINQWCNSEDSAERNILRLLYDKIRE